MCAIQHETLYTFIYITRHKIETNDFPLYTFMYINRHVRYTM